jgi:hypothetical protein
MRKGHIYCPVLHDLAFLRSTKYLHRQRRNAVKTARAHRQYLWKSKDDLLMPYNSPHRSYRGRHQAARKVIRPQCAASPSRPFALDIFPHGIRRSWLTTGLVFQFCRRYNRIKRTKHTHVLFVPFDHVNIPAEVFRKVRNLVKHVCDVVDQARQ